MVKYFCSSITKLLRGIPPACIIALDPMETNDENAIKSLLLYQQVYLLFAQIYIYIYKSEIELINVTKDCEW